MRRSDVRTTLEQVEADLTTLDNGLADTFDRVRGWCNTGIASSPPGGPAGRTHGTSPTERTALGPRDVFARDLANAEADLQILRDAMRCLAKFTAAVLQAPDPASDGDVRPTVAASKL